MSLEKVKTEEPVKEILTVGDVKYTGDQLVEMISENALLKEKTGSVDLVLETANKYGVTPDELIQESGKALELMANLIDNGVIDQEGKVIVKKQESVIPPVKTQTSTASENTNLPPELVAQMKEVIEVLPKYKEEILRLREANESLTGVTIRNDLKLRFSDLSDADYKEVVKVAKANPGKHINEVTQEYLTSKGVSKAEEEKKWAEHFGIDYAMHNQRKEMSGDSGTAKLVEGKKISFRKGKRADPDAVRPGDVFRQIIKARNIT